MNDPTAEMHTNRDTSADELVQRLHSGQIEPAALSIDQRRACVEKLTDQSLTNAEIATIMRMSVATIRRDRAALRRSRAVMPDRALGDELLGELEHLSQTSIARLARLARDESNPAYCRMWAEEAAVRVYCRFLDQARRLGYVEDGARRLRQQREDDPTEQQRARARLHQMLSGVAAPPT